MTNDQISEKQSEGESDPRPLGVPSKFGWAGFGLITMAATTGFLIMAVSLDVLDDFPDWGVSGGIVSAVGGIYLSKKCHSWADFWACVWIWMAAAALVAGLGVWAVSSQSEVPSSESRTNPTSPERSATSDAEEGPVKSREGARIMGEAGFGVLYQMQYGREATRKERRDAFGYELAICEALDSGMTPRKIYRRLVDSGTNQSEFMFFHMSFTAAVAQVCDEYSTAHDRYLDSVE